MSVRMSDRHMESGPIVPVLLSVSLPPDGDERSTISGTVRIQGNERHRDHRLHESHYEFADECPTDAFVLAVDNRCSGVGRGTRRCSRVFDLFCNLWGRTETVLLTLEANVLSCGLG